LPIDTGDPAPASHKLAKLCREHADAGDVKFADGHDAHRRAVRGADRGDRAELSDLLVDGETAVERMSAPSWNSSPSVR